MVDRSEIKELVFKQPYIKETARVCDCVDINEKDVEENVKEATSYAILSHRWLPTGELKFRDFLKLKSLSLAGLSGLIESPEKLGELKELRGAAILKKASEAYVPSPTGTRDGWEVLRNMEKIADFLSGKNHLAHDFVKLVKFCKVVRDHKKQYNCDYVWMDTGCINKDSSAQQEESIRSMFRWYQNSRICIVHLGETISAPDIQQGGEPWFTRGWTLQELLAPKEIKFFTKSWLPLTTKPNDKIGDEELGIPLWKRISKITHIPEAQLLGQFEPGTDNVREKMVWASGRNTMRIEDMAYCLIGIFGVSLSIAYGEGKMAFYRLQVEILQSSHDHGLFTWNGSPSFHNSILAAGPEAFAGPPLTVEKDPAVSADPYMLTNCGLSIWLSIYGVVKQGSKYGLEGLERIEVPPQIKDHRLMIGILGNSTAGRKSIAIMLESVSSTNRQYKRITEHDVFELQHPDCDWKPPERILIK